MKYVQEGSGYACRGCAVSREVELLKSPRSSPSGSPTYSPSPPFHTQPPPHHHTTTAASRANEAPTTTASPSAPLPTSAPGPSLRLSVLPETTIILFPSSSSPQAQAHLPPGPPCRRATHPPKHARGSDEPYLSQPCKLYRGGARQPR